MNPIDGIARDASNLFAKWEWVAYIVAVLLIFGIIFLVLQAKHTSEDIGFFEVYNLRDISTNESINQTNETNTADDLNREIANTTQPTPT